MAAKSRPERWLACIAEARAAQQRMSEAAGQLDDAFSNLRDVQSEYQEWLDGLPENLADSPVAEKLNEVTGIDLEYDEGLSAEEVEDKLSEAEAADLPRGFGRD